MKCIWAMLSSSHRGYNTSCRSLIRLSLFFIVLCIHVFELSHCFRFLCWPWLCDLSKKFAENSIPQINNGKEPTDRAKVCFIFEYLTACVSISATVCMCEVAFWRACKSVWVTEEYVKGETIVPLMPCLVRSEMDGRCSTCELLFLQTVSFGLHSHPSSLPWCLPLPAASSGPANQSYGHWFLLPTTQKKSTPSSCKRFFLFFGYTRRAE